MTLTRRQMMKGVTAVGAITLGSTLIGCSSKSSSSAGTSGGKTETATLWALTDDKTNLDPGIQSWNTANTDQKIDAQYFANDAYKTKIRTSVGAGSAPTLIFSWAGGTLSDYVKGSKVVDLSSATSSIKDKFNASVFDLGVIDGKTYAIPMNPSYPVILYYNEQVLSKAGVDVPKTWDEFLTAVAKLKTRTSCRSRWRAAASGPS
ncbi:MAG: extracellular solute-binding protein [Propionibacterium sp.]